MIVQATGAQLALDVVGIFVFAISGALVAVDRGLDLVGVVVLAAVAGLGGGILRDVLLGATPPVGISDWRLLLAAALAGLGTFRFHREVTRIAQSVAYLDALGLAVFSVSGAVKSLQLGTTAVTAVLIGLLTGVGGGVLRDVLVGRVPEVLRRELYAVPAALGAIVVVAAAHYGTLNQVVLWVAAAVTFLTRALAIKFQWHLPTAFRTREDT